MANLVDFSSLNEMLYGEEKYIKEFAEAAITSFSEFQENYALYLAARDEQNFRRAGHKIRPVAQMLGLDLIVDEYENAKKLLLDEAPDSAINDSIKKVDSICREVLIELRDIAEG